jgi:hypothetical protein
MSSLRNLRSFYCQFAEKNGNRDRDQIDHGPWELHTEKLQQRATTLQSNDVHQTQGKNEYARYLGTHCANKGSPTNTMNRQPQHKKLCDSSTLSTYPTNQTQSAGYLAVCADLCPPKKYAGGYAENSDMTLHTLAHLRNGEIVRLERQEAAFSKLSEGDGDNSASISNVESTPQMKRHR